MIEWHSWYHCHSLSLAPGNPVWFWFTFLVLAYPVCTRQNPKSHKMVVVVVLYCSCQAGIVFFCIYSRWVWTTVGRMSHYSRLYDIQTLAMLSCVFAGHSKRRAAPSVESSLRVDRRRIISQTATSNAADVAPSNVCCCIIDIVRMWDNG